MVSRQPFDVALRELRGQDRTCHVVREATLEAPLAADVDSRVPAGAEAVAEVDLKAFDGGVSVSGIVTSAWEGECRRCLKPLGGPLVGEAKEIFRRGGGPDDGTYAMGDDVINLREMVFDCLFAALPVLPLCREDCRGICPVCGADLNVAPCACERREPDPRWSALDALRDL